MNFHHWSFTWLFQCLTSKHLFALHWFILAHWYTFSVDFLAIDSYSQHWLLTIWFLLCIIRTHYCIMELCMPWCKYHGHAQLLSNIILRLQTKFTFNEISKCPAFPHCACIYYKVVPPLSDINVPSPSLDKPNSFLDLSCLGFICKILHNHGLILYLTWLLHKYGYACLNLMRLHLYHLTF